MQLVIVESPTKAKTLKKYLGRGYQVEASMGHLRDLPKSKLGVDVEHRFEPEYIQVRGKAKIVGKLKKLSQEAEYTILAMDPDREGEAIAWHLLHLLKEPEKKSKTKKSAKGLAPKKQDAKFQRVTFHEITKEAILSALKNRGVLNVALVDAQQARRVLDRLVGYKLSPLLWRKIQRGLSAGRVQSVALRMIVEREAQIKAYVPKEYWEVSVLLCTGENSAKPISVVQESFAEYTPKQDEFIASLIEVDGKKIAVDDDPNKSRLSDQTKAVTQKTQADFRLDSKEIAQPIIDDLKTAHYKVKTIERKERRRSSPPPFTTSTLQQTAARRFGWSGKQTMRIAQQLYEAGYITYHRTDSLNLAASAVEAARVFITSEYGPSFLPAKPNFFKTKAKSAQEAHEAIRPTSVNAVSLSNISGGETPSHTKLFGLIRQRLLASQMVPAVYDQTSIEVEAKGTKAYALRASGSILKFAGWLAVYQDKKQEVGSMEQAGNTSVSNDAMLPEVKEKQDLGLVDMAAAQKFTQAPPRFNDASLIKELELRGIGRPSTYASIISVLVDRGYVLRNDKRFEPTSIGEKVIEFLLKYFGEILDYDFTAQMEADLDRIAEGGKDWKVLIEDFYGPFEKKLTEVGETAERVDIPVEMTGEKCPECKEGNVIIKTGRFGKFFACDKFPECKYTKQYVEKIENFPCPDCGAEVVVKRTKKGRMFFGCSSYPKCTWASWSDPRKQPQAEEAAQ
jgi:DNA topoisomerase-1